MMIMARRTAVADTVLPLTLAWAEGEVVGSAAGRGTEAAAMGAGRASWRVGKPAWRCCGSGG